MSKIDARECDFCRKIINEKEVKDLEGKDWCGKCLYKSCDKCKKYYGTMQGATRDIIYQSDKGCTKLFNICFKCAYELDKLIYKFVFEKECENNN